MLRRVSGIVCGAGRSNRPSGAPRVVTSRIDAPIGGIAALGLALLISACQVPNPQLRSAESTPVTATPPAQQADASPDANQAPDKPAAKPKPPAVALETTPAVAHDALDLGPAAHLTGEPDEFIGLAPSAVRRALGDPTQIRSEAPAQVWQYVNGDCIVDLYLYDRSDEAGGFAVTYVEARSHRAEQAPTARCLKMLLERPTASAS